MKRVRPVLDRGRRDGSVPLECDRAFRANKVVVEEFSCNGWQSLQMPPPIAIADGVKS
jgi:hypothetical protein